MTLTEANVNTEHSRLTLLSSLSALLVVVTTRSRSGKTAEAGCTGNTAQVGHGVEGALPSLQYYSLCRT